MERFGITGGLIIKNVPMAAIILGGAYMLNKLGPKLGNVYAGQCAQSDLDYVSIDFHDRFVTLERMIYVAH
jgi:hypothetical protein